MIMLIDEINLDKYLVPKESGICQTTYWKDISKEKGYLPVIIPINKYYLLGIEYSSHLYKTIDIVDGLNFLADSNEDKTTYIEFLLKFLKEKQYNEITIRLSVFSNLNSDKNVSDVFNKKGYTKETWGTYLIDLTQTPEAIFEKFSRYTRKNIKKAEKEGLKVTLINYSDIYDKYWMTLKKLKLENGESFSIPEHVIQKDILLTKDRYHYYVVEDTNGTYLACLGMYILDGTATEVGSATAKECFEKNIPAQHLLHWQMFQEAKRLKANWFNLAGVNPQPKTSKEIGIKVFKSRFGGKYIEYDTYTKTSKILAIMIALNKLLRNLLKNVGK